MHPVASGAAPSMTVASSSAPVEIRSLFRPCQNRHSTPVSRSSDAISPFTATDSTAHTPPVSSC